MMAFDPLTILTKQQDKDKINWKYEGTLVTEEEAIHKRWTESCVQLYKYKLKTDANIINNADNIGNRKALFVTNT